MALITPQRTQLSLFGFKLNLFSIWKANKEHVIQDLRDQAGPKRRNQSAKSEELGKIRAAETTKTAPLTYKC